MGIFSKITGMFKRKKSVDDLLKGMPPLTAGTNPALGPAREITSETANAENVKARMDLVLTQMDSLRVQYETLNERIANIERMVKELYDMAKSS